MSPVPPRPAIGFELVTIDSLGVALARMGINVPKKDIIKVICEVEKEKRQKELAECKSHAIAARLLSFKLTNMLVALHPPDKSQFTTTLHSVSHQSHAPRPEQDDALAEVGPRRLKELTEKAFPDGRVPPHLAIWCRPCRVTRVGERDGK